MPEEAQLIVYTLEFCPHCDSLKEFLKKTGCVYTERNMSTPESLTELRFNGVFVNEAPVLQKESEFYTSDDLFPSGKLDEDRILNLVSGK